MAEKPEIQKQQKTTTYSWVHLVNRLVQIMSKVYETSSKTWQSHTKHAWSKQKLKIGLGHIRSSHSPASIRRNCSSTLFNRSSSPCCSCRSLSLVSKSARSKEFSFSKA